jgi:quercetin dioxygenase-like cupin family protein
MRLPCVRPRYAGGNVRAMPLPAVVVHSAEGEILDYGDGDSSRVLASGKATGGAFSVVEHRLAAGTGGPPLHRHERLCDAFFVLEGKLTLQIEERSVLAREGTFACFPPGIAHTFRNESNQIVRVLNINAPGGWEKVLRALATKGRGEQVSQGEVGRIAAERDMIVLD